MFDLATVPLISFQQAKRGLQRRKAPSLDTALNALGSLHVAGVSAAILQEFGEADIPGLAAEELDRMLEGELLCTELIGKAFTRIESCFPVWPELEENFINMEMEGEFGFCIELLYFPWSGDDFDEQLEEMKFDTNQRGYFLALFLWLDVGMDIWLEGIEHFTWPEYLPRCISSERKMTGFNWDKFERQMKKAGLDDFLKLFVSMGKETGNPFLDWTAEECYESGYAYTLENVRFLREKWQAAQPYIEATNRCNEAGLRDAGAGAQDIRSLRDL